jgi:hypothetical protein
MSRGRVVFAASPDVIVVIVVVVATATAVVITVHVVGVATRPGGAAALVGSVQ